MNAIIETQLKFRGQATLSEFFRLLREIDESKDLKELKEKLNHARDYYNVSYNFFLYGFSGSHFWVKEKLNDKRLILVKDETSRN